MIMPKTGKRKMSNDQRSLCEGGRLDLMISTVYQHQISKYSFLGYCGKGVGVTIPKKMTSRINTTRPRIPPPVPYCQAFPPAVAASSSPATIGAARARVKSERLRRSVRRVVWIIVMGGCGLFFLSY